MKSPPFEVSLLRVRLLDCSASHPMTNLNPKPWQLKEPHAIILIQIYVLAFAYITLTFKLANTFQILVNLLDFYIYFLVFSCCNHECIQVNSWIVTFNVTMSKCTKLHSCNEFTFICARWILQNEYRQSQSSWTHMGRFLSRVYIFQAWSHAIFSSRTRSQSLWDLIGIMRDLWGWVYMGTIRWLVTFKLPLWNKYAKQGNIMGQLNP